MEYRNLRRQARVSLFRVDDDDEVEVEVDGAMIE